MKMITAIKETLKDIIKVKRPKGYEWYAFRKDYFSQEGEDIILEQIFATQTAGFFIDIGAHHPFKYSNTFLFYRKGWRGINIDPLPGSMKLFKKYRPKDINLELGISNKPGTATYYMFSIPELNGFKRQTVLPTSERKRFPLVGTKQVHVTTLNSVIKKHCNTRIKIDFLSVDVEGHEIEVLKSLNIKKYAPQVICVEEREAEKKTIEELKVTKYLKLKNYVFFAKTSHSLFFKAK